MVGSCVGAFVLLAIWLFIDATGAPSDTSEMKTRRRQMKWRGENAWWKRNELNAQLARVIVIPLPHHPCYFHLSVDVPINGTWNSHREGRRMNGELWWVLISARRLRRHRGCGSDRKAQVR